MIAVYLAAPWARRREARVARDQLFAAGFRVTSRWLSESNDVVEAESPEALRYEANRDLEDIDAADAVVVLNLEKSEGKAVETGYALATGKPIALVGACSNVFHYLNDVEQFERLDDAIRWLGSC